MNQITKVPEGSIASTGDNQPAVLSEGPTNLLSAIVAMASNPAVDVQKLSALLQMQERMEARQAEQQFNEAFHRMSMEMPRIKKNGTVEYKNKQTGTMEKSFNFATWENIDAVIRPLLQREGFSLSFDTALKQGDGGGIIVTGTLSHVAGHKRTASIPLALDNSGGKNNIQGMGSTFSYGKRYTATALLNLVTEGEDDDGVRGGTKFITDAQCAELHALLQETGRQEGPFLDRLFAGAVHSVEEIEAGSGFLAAKSTLEGIRRQQAQKGGR